MRKPKYDFSILEVGDSFIESSERSAAVRAAASRYKRDNPGWDYITRDQNEEHVRIWRKT